MQNYEHYIAESNSRLSDDLMKRIAQAKIDFGDDEEFLEDALKEIRMTAQLT